MGAQEKALCGGFRGKSRWAKVGTAGPWGWSRRAVVVGVNWRDRKAAASRCTPNMDDRLLLEREREEWLRWQTASEGGPYKAKRCYGVA